ncbi:MAG: neutral zinc metallopeptidase [Bacteroidota bacterium]
MKWLGGTESNDVEESSGGGSRRGVLFGGGIIGLIGAVIYLFTGINPSQLFDQSGNSPQINTQPGSGNESRNKQFAKVIFQGTTVVWDSLFNAMGEQYVHPTLHLFTNEVDAEGCGYASSATGPFYCPADQKIYLDLSFFDELENRFKAPGESAWAYVIAHEVGHHIQNLMGTSAKMDAARNRLSESAYNKLSVKLELQADFYAGVWAHYEALNHHNNIVIERADIDSALNAAHQIGDDRLQQQYQSHVTPDSFTHGSSAQRMYWFKKGFDTGDIKQGDTFAEGNYQP